MWQPYAKYKTGSTLFLGNCKDIDYLYVFERYSDLEKFEKMAKHKLECDEHCRLKEDLETKLYPYSYLHHFWELLEGQEVVPCSIYEHKKDYAQMLLDFADKIKNTKHWYHFILGTYALKNGKGKNFTKTQLAKAQKGHDRELTKEDLQDLFDYLTNLVNN